MMILILFTLGLIFIGVPFAVAIAAVIDAASRKRFSRRPTRLASVLPEDARVCAC